MALHPIKALNHVIGEYSDYLQTEFRAKDPQLCAALERELDAPGFLAQEPFFQAHRPFVPGKRWRDLPIDPKLAEAIESRSRTDTAYVHQSGAIEELLSPSPRPLVVTTGTGSGKTEAFLLPVIQNAFEDAVRFNKSGLTAILVYPMNALANDQFIRINEYLDEAGFAGAVRVEQYDRGTSQAKRQEMRANPPHILLTNYMMLEYLLVRPADREDIFANHRCRFLVLDEVHTYRGVLGSNIGLLTRRLRVHLKQARQDWHADVSEAEQPKRYPSIVPVGTSATIKSLSEEDLPREEVVRLRDEAVQEFFASLTGEDPAQIRVFGEELQDIAIPNEAAYPAKTDAVDLTTLRLSDGEEVRKGLCRIAGLDESTPVEVAVRRCRLLWDLNRWLVSRPMSISQLATQLKAETPERADATDEALQAEVEAGLVLGAALPEDTSGGLRLRAHRFIRGGWKFHRCINPSCGKLYPMGEEQCSACNHATAPLYLCRNCGADYLRFAGDPEQEPLRPTSDPREPEEWLLYEPERFDIEVEDSEDESEDEEIPRRRGHQRVPKQIKKRPVLHGSFDPATRKFSQKAEDDTLTVTLAGARTRCLCCGGTAGSRNVITQVALGTSAAVKVLSEGLTEALAEANEDRPNHDGKERLLIFSDSRQDAAHQARFIIFASRYDRMRRRVVELLKTHGPLTIQKTVELMGELAAKRHDNPYVPAESDWIPDDARERIRAWEEAPLLDEIAVNAGYRATFVNLGLVGVSYHRLDEYVRVRGEGLAKLLDIRLDELEYVCLTLLDEMRTRGALSRPMLIYHPAHVACPRSFESAEWERRVKQPRGYPLTRQGAVVAYMDRAEVPTGITVNNAWRKPRAGGRGPSLERVLRRLIEEFGGPEPDEHTMESILDFLKRGSFLTEAELCGARDRYRLLQVNAEVVRLSLLTEADRRHCSVCGYARSGIAERMPCPRCHGTLVTWPDSDLARHRTVQRIRRIEEAPLVAGEHTAQITTQARMDLESDFKARPEQSAVNVLACSPTLEMGIDVGGLDAVIMRNVPPRPDNYAQRGGRAGRRSRVGMVLGYARSTPHDQYFYDKPREMIAGEVPAPSLSLGNQDVIVRHLYAIVFGLAEPGLAGRMVEYVLPNGDINREAVDALVDAVRQQFGKAISIAIEAWGRDVLGRAMLDENQLMDCLNRLPDSIRNVFDRTSRQVIELRQALDRYSQSLEGRYAGTRAGDLVARLLGIRDESRRNQTDADDRSAGYPLRRFAEFGLLPGYEFPSEPATLRLIGDEYEDDPVTVNRRFGIGQFQPDAHVYARRKRWRVIGLDTSSPWNPRSEGPGWSYRLCSVCDLRYNANEPKCPRCGVSPPGRPFPAYEFAGFVARKEETPVMDEEERYAVRNLVHVYSQWDGDIVGRWRLPNGWALRLSRNEEVRWLNEGQEPSEKEIQGGVPLLHQKAKGYLLCPSCGRMLNPPEAPGNERGGRRNAGRGGGAITDSGHWSSCPQQGAVPTAIAIATAGKVEILRVVVPVPKARQVGQWTRWGLSLGYALLNGIQHHFMLDPGELDFELEGPWTHTEEGVSYEKLSLAFIDSGLGGSGYLERIAESFQLGAKRAIEHLDHRDCESACYRCLKSYNNQRYHEFLSWPVALPALEELASAPPVSNPAQVGDIDDPRPWLEAYNAGVGSPLEFRFLRLFESFGFSPEKQVPIYVDGANAPISVADFAVSDRRIAIYVDGAAFHIGQNLRRDRYIRDRLRNASPPWTVVELRASDLNDVGRLSGLFAGDSSHQS